MERVGDDGAVGERERCSELSVDFGEQDRLRRRRGAVDLGQAYDPLLIGGGRKSKRHAPVSRDSPSWLGSALRERVSVGSSAEVIRLCSSEGNVESWGNHVVSFQPQRLAACRQRGLEIGLGRKSASDREVGGPRGARASSLVSDHDP
jgi:hypothetical protein